MTSTLDVSVIVAVRNGALTIRPLIESLLALAFPREKREIIIVDNSSTDETLRIVAEFGADVRVMHESRRGAAAARNCGIRAAGGWAVVFTDADAVVEPDWLTALITPLADDTVGIVGGRILSVEPCNRIERFGERIHDQEAAVAGHEPYVTTGNWASRREVLLAAGLFDESLLRGQDVDLAWRVRAAGYRLVYEPTAVVRHRNEKTLPGLVREGFTHGLHGVRVLEKLGKARPRKLRRVVKALRRLTQEHDATDGALALLFDLGKVAGQMVAQLRGRAVPRSAR